MMKIVWLLVLASLACRLIAGRWPWQFLSRNRNDRSRLGEAQRLLGVAPDASRHDILEAHRRLITEVHPDRGGTAERVHQANDARDLLLDAIDNRSDRP
jgi:hypothetical protein